MTRKWTTVSGVLVAGYGVASGRHAPHYPGGTIRAQQPHFRARGVDLSAYFPGTLNVSIAPHRFALRRPRHTLRDVEWWPGVRETFSFSPCRLLVPDAAIDGLIYYPHPETKPDHIQPPTVLEILAPFVPHLLPGAGLEVQLDPDEVAIE